MALIICPECGKEISDKAQACIHCGYPLNSNNDDTHTKIEEILPDCIIEARTELLDVFNVFDILLDAWLDDMECVERPEIDCVLPKIKHHIATLTLKDDKIYNQYIICMYEIFLNRKCIGVDDVYGIHSLINTDRLTEESKDKILILYKKYATELYSGIKRAFYPLFREFYKYRILDKKKFLEEIFEDEYEYFLYGEEGKKEVCVPRCPTCQSTNVQKLSLFWGSGAYWSYGPLARQYQCNNCSYEW